MPPLLVETYSTAAEKLALNAFRIGDVNGLIPCKPSSAADAKCRDAVCARVRAAGLPAAAVGRRVAALQRARSARRPRRPASSSKARASSSKRCCSRPTSCSTSKAAPDGTLADYDVASRLSYHAVEHDARSGRCSTRRRKASCAPPRARVKAARRMLDDPRARQALDEFFDEWLRLRPRDQCGEGAAAVPEFTPELAAAMAEETRRLLQHLVWERPNFMEAFTADYSFVSSDLATLYKRARARGAVRDGAVSRRAPIAPACSGRRRSWPRRPGRPRPRPPARGIFIREQLLCQHVPPPPPGVNTTLPEPTSPDNARTRRQLMIAHVENPTCASCHRLMDPIGFGLENFDAIGALAREGDDPDAGPSPRPKTRPQQAAKRSSSTSTPRARSPGCRTRSSPTPSSWGAFWPTARCARNASCGRCSGTPMAGWRRQRTRNDRAAFRSFGIPDSTSKIC